MSNPPWAKMTASTSINSYGPPATIFYPTDTAQGLNWSVAPPVRDFAPLPTVLTSGGQTILVVPDFTVFDAVELTCSGRETCTQVGIWSLSAIFFGTVHVVKLLLDGCNV